MFCPNCGTQNEDDATFCTNCGATIPDRSTPGVQQEETLSDEDNISRLEAASGQIAESEPEPEPEPEITQEPQPTQEAQAEPELPQEIDAPAPKSDIDTKGLQPKKDWKPWVVVGIFIVLIACAIVCCCMFFTMYPYMIQ